MSNHEGLTQRGFLQTLGAAAPSLKLMLGDVTGSAGAGPAPPPGDSSPKFTAVDCSPFFTAPTADLAGPARPVPQFMGEFTGRQRFRGIPFRLGPGGEREKRTLPAPPVPRTGSCHGAGGIASAYAPARNRALIP